MAMASSVTLLAIFCCQFGKNCKMPADGDQRRAAL
jgi:hypothetical protein